MEVVAAAFRRTSEIKTGSFSLWGLTVGSGPFLCTPVGAD